MSTATDLQHAFGPLLDRTKRRADRIRQLHAQPATPERDRAIAAEQREIELFKQTAASVEALIERSEKTQKHAEAVIRRVQHVAEEANHYERLFHIALDHASRLANPAPAAALPPWVVRCQAFLDTPRMRALNDLPVEERRKRAAITSYSIPVPARIKALVESHLAANPSSPA